MDSMRSYSAGVMDQQDAIKIAIQTYYRVFLRDQMAFMTFDQQCQRTVKALKGVARPQQL